MVLIDDATLAQQGRWPWPRARLATLVRAVSAQQPKAIGMDILLPEAEDEQNDSALQSAIQSAPNMVLAAKISSSPTGNLWMDPLPRFAQAAKGVGHVQAMIDFDGLCRGIPIQEPSAEGLRTHSRSNWLRWSSRACRRRSLLTQTRPASNTSPRCRLC